MAARLETGRRSVLRGAVALAAAAGLAVARRGESAGEAPAARGRLKQSVSRWCFGKMTLDELCGHAARIGYKGIDLLGPEGLARRPEARPRVRAGLARGPGHDREGPEPRREPRADPRRAREGHRPRGRGGGPQPRLLLGQPRRDVGRGGAQELRAGPQADRSPRRRRRASPCASSSSTARSTTRTTCATTRRGAWSSSRRSARRA